MLLVDAEGLENGLRRRGPVSRKPGNGVVLVPGQDWARTVMCHWGPPRWQPMKSLPI